MKNKYLDLIDQTFVFPQPEFSVEDGELIFHDVPLMEVIKQYGTPVKLTYLPKIRRQVERARQFFHVAMARADYSRRFAELDLPDPIKKAVICHRGALTPDFEYLQQFLNTEQDEQTQGGES